jgi:hypothetical protein
MLEFSAFHGLSRFESGLRHLPHLPVRAQPWRPLYLGQSRAEVAPRVTPGLLHDPLESPRQHPQRHVGMKALPRPVRDRAQRQPTCAGAPRRLAALTWRVAQGPIGRGQAVVVALSHAFAVALGFRPACGRHNAPSPACGHAHIPTVTAARPQRTHPRAVAFTPDLLASGQRGRECTPDLRAMGPRALVLVGMVTDDSAPTTCARTHHHVLAPQVIRPRWIAPGAREDRVGHRGASAYPGGLALRAR